MSVGYFCIFHSNSAHIALANMTVVFNLQCIDIQQRDAASHQSNCSAIDLKKKNKEGGSKRIVHSDSIEEPILIP